MVNRTARAHTTTSSSSPLPETRLSHEYLPERPSALRPTSDTTLSVLFWPFFDVVLDPVKDLEQTALGVALMTCTRGS